MISIACIIRLPNRIPTGRALNELLSKTISATRLDAAAPEYIATPRSACFNAKASFTPSPTIPTNLC